jgi:hypothetical protein
MFQSSVKPTSPRSKELIATAQRNGNLIQPLLAVSIILSHSLVFTAKGISTSTGMLFYSKSVFTGAWR